MPSLSPFVFAFATSQSRDDADSCSVTAFLSHRMNTLVGDDIRRKRDRASASASAFAEIAYSRGYQEWKPVHSAVVEGMHSCYNLMLVYSLGY